MPSPGGLLARPLLHVRGINMGVFALFGRHASQPDCEIVRCPPPLLKAMSHPCFLANPHLWATLRIPYPGTMACFAIQASPLVSCSFADIRPTNVLTMVQEESQLLVAPRRWRDTTLAKTRKLSTASWATAHNSTRFSKLSLAGSTSGCTLQSR